VGCESGVAHVPWGTSSDCFWKRCHMRRVVRAIVVGLFAVAAVLLLAFSQTLVSMVMLTTTTLFAIGGTGHPLSIPPDSPTFVTDYVGGANMFYAAPSGLCGGVGTPCSPAVGVVTPEQAFPVTGTMTWNQSVAQGQQNLNACLQGSSSCVWTDPTTGTTQTGNQPSGPYVVLGYSQGATVATMEKRALCANGTCQTFAGGNPSFILVANPNRPNGGILERGNIGNTQPTIPFFGLTFSGATPTNTPYTTVDVARQYDGVADAPTNPLNLLADANALAGYYYLHGNYLGLGQPTLQGQYGDTTYYMFMTYPLPILMPLETIPVVGPIAVDMLDPVTRVLVESAYNRTANPGAPTPFNIFYLPNPVQLGTGLILAIPTGLLLGFQDITGARTPGSTPAYLVGPNAVYYLGGPPVFVGCGTPPCGAPTPAASTNPNATQTASTTDAPANSTNNQPATTPLGPPVTNPITTVVSDLTPPSTPGPQNPLGSTNNGTTTGSNVPILTGPTGTPLGTTGGSPLSGVANTLTNGVTNTINGVLSIGKSGVSNGTSGTNPVGGVVSKITGGGVKK
jgi:PE-PPE domain